MKRYFVLIGVSALVLPLAFADNDHDGNNNSQAVPFVYVGKAGDCGTGTPAGSRIVTSAWLAGLGLPDNGTSLNGVTASANDPHFGLLLSKNGPITDCSSAGAKIVGTGQITVPAATATPLEFGFDIRNGTHCGAGAPRFNIVTSDGVTHFAGCSDGTLTPAPQDPHWTRVRFTPAQISAPLAPGEQIKSISIVFDEGTGTASAQDPMGSGLAVIDNIDINGHIITGGAGPGAGAGQDNSSNNKNGNDKQDN